MALLFRVTEIALIDEFIAFLSAFFLYSAIPYLFALAILGGHVAERVGAGRQTSLTFGLMMVLSLLSIRIYLSLSMLILGQDLIRQGLID